MAGGPGGKNRGKRVVRMKVRAWNNEKIMYGRRVTGAQLVKSCYSRYTTNYALVIGFLVDHQ